MITTIVRIVMYFTCFLDNILKCTYNNEIDINLLQKYL